VVWNEWRGRRDSKFILLLQSPVNSGVATSPAKQPLQSLQTTTLRLSFRAGWLVILSRVEALLLNLKVEFV